MRHSGMIGLELYVHDHLQAKINEKILNRFSSTLIKQTFSRYCNKASTAANTTNVTPNAIPV